MIRYGDQTNGEIAKQFRPHRKTGTTPGSRSLENDWFYGGESTKKNSLQKEPIHGGNGAADCGLTNPPGGAIYAVALVATVLNPNFDAFLGVSDASDLSTVLSNVALNYSHGQGLSTMFIAPQVASNNIYFAMPSGLTAQIIFDVLGYQVVPDGTAVECSTQSFAPVSIGATNSTGTAISPTCSVGYALTAGSCHSSAVGLSVSQSKATGGSTAWLCSALNRGAVAANLTATVNCCRMPGK